MAKTRRHRSKKRGGNRELEIVFLQLAKATMLLTKNVKVTLTTDEEEEVTHNVPMRDYIAFSLGKQMIDDGAEPEVVTKAMEAAGFEFLPNETYPYVTLTQ